MVDFTELSNGTLYRTAAQTSPDEIGDISQFMWPTYQRLTLADGGDATASFSFSSTDKYMEYWLGEYLGASFRESYRGETAYIGRVHTIRLTYQRVLLTTSIDGIYNRVACYYTSVLSGSSFLGDFYEDTDSQEKWGIRVLLIRPTDEIGLSEANQLAQEALAQTKSPRISRGRLAGRGKIKRGTLQVNIEGYTSSLDSQIHNEVNPGQANASDEVAAALAGASFVSIGDIAANTRQVTITSDQRPKLQRIKWIAEQRDSAGRRYNYGCVGSTAFDYGPADSENIRYRVQVKPPIPIHMDALENYIPSPLVRPGGVSFITDIMPGRAHANPILDDPRAQFDRSVSYSINGADLRGIDWNESERVNALQMAIVAGR